MEKEQARSKQPDAPKQTTQRLNMETIAAGINANHPTIVIEPVVGAMMINEPAQFQRKLS